MVSSEWDFGDGQNATYSGKIDAWHKYWKSGTYKVILTIDHLAGRVRISKTLAIRSISSNSTLPQESAPTLPPELGEEISLLEGYDPFLVRAETAIAALAIIFVVLCIGIKLVRRRR